MQKISPKTKRNQQMVLEFLKNEKYSDSANVGLLLRVKIRRAQIILKQMAELGMISRVITNSLDFPSGIRTIVSLVPFKINRKEIVGFLNEQANRMAKRTSRTQTLFK
jgi:hypothetical protein